MGKRSTKSKGRARPRPRRRAAKPESKRQERTPNEARKVSMRYAVVTDGPPKPLAPIRSALRALTEQELFNVPAPSWELEMRTEQGGFNVITGPRGSYKTFLIASMVFALTSARAWFGAQALRAGPVMVVPLEDLRGWRKRWEAARSAAGLTADERLAVYTWPHPVNLFTGQGVDDLQREADRLRVIHLVLDPWADAITGADENSQKDVGIAIGRVKQLRGQGRSVTVVHHTGHDESRERGSTVLGGAADTMMLMKGDRDTGSVLVECAKQRNGERFAPLRLDFDPGALVLRSAGVSLVSQLPKQQQTVLDALRTLTTNNGHHAGVGIKAWLERSCHVEGVKRRTFFDAKRKLLDAQRVQEVDGEKFLPA